MNAAPSDDIRQEPAIQKLLARMPEQVQQSFTETQLSHLHLALGARESAKHKFDLRGTFGLGRWRYYYVMLAGRYSVKEQRSRKARLFLRFVLLFSIIVGSVLLYLFKSALGVDMFSEFSLGLWGWLNQR